MDVRRGLRRSVTVLLAIALFGQAGTLAAADDEAERPMVATALPQGDLGPMAHVWQSLNNCGPAAVVMALSTLGVSVDQETARLPLRGADVRRGMGPAGVDPWVAAAFGLRSMSRMNGTNDLVKRLVTNGFAPMVTQWMQDPTVSRIAHWRTVRGYDDARGVFYVNDSMLGANVPLAYDWFGANWQPFSYRYMVIYAPKDEARLRAVIGIDWTESLMRDRFYARAKAEAQAQDTSAAWLTYGEAAYQDGWFEEAVAAFDRGMALGPVSGVFTVRNSYPLALRALARQNEADVAVARLAATTVTPATVVIEPDAFAVLLATRRATPYDATQPAAR
ncbi:MAG TPA: C39 family peptidase [Candidatus Limnocylindria bacterium]|jgi:hypothetical protein